MAPLKKRRVRGEASAADTVGGTKSLLALDEDDQKDFERRVAEHKNKQNNKNKQSNSNKDNKNDNNETKKQNQGKKRRSGADSSGSNIPGVMYIGHIPRGFFEKEMRSFFSQFGTVTRLRLARSTRTGGSKGYAFIEFRHEEVAKVAADTMNNYLMYRQLLKCEFVPAEKVHPETFKNSHRPFDPPKRAELNRERHNAEKTPKKEAAAGKRRSKMMKKKMAGLKELGIDYQCQVEGPGLGDALVLTASVEEADMDVDKNGIDDGSKVSDAKA